MPQPPQEALLDPAEILRQRFAAAISAAYSVLEGEADPLIAPAKNPDFGDFQSNAAMPLAKRLGAKPRDVAAAVVEKLDLADLAEPLDASSIAGPGFINVRLRTDALASLLQRLDDPDLGLHPPPNPDTVIVDLCGVNLAKQMHVGHLRSTVIGDAIARTLERLGADVIRQNHVGDWGLPIAMVTERLRVESDAGTIDLNAIDLETLNRLYRDAQADCAADRKGLAAARRWDMGPKALAELEEQVAGAEEALARAKAMLVKLQSGDPEAKAIWTRIYDVTMAECLATCRRLHTKITQADSAGESSYAEQLAGIVQDLESRGVATESDGALVVRVEDVAEPCIVRKSDGGFLYATTDLAAIRRRVQTLGAARAIYAVDARQALHFRQVFGAAALAGYTTTTDARRASLEHAAFGTVLGEDNRPLKTRSGENVKLADLLDEAVNRASAAVREKNHDLDDAEADAVAEAVGIAAIKYADLSTERVKDYVFSFDRMLAFEGNTGPYLLYALVRIRSIFRRASEQGIQTDLSAPLLIAEPEEKSLALALLRFPAAVRAAGSSCEPHRLCAYAYDLAVAFSQFFDRCHVLKAADDRVRAARLRLCDLTGRVLADTLHTLGLPTVDRM